MKFLWWSFVSIIVSSHLDFISSGILWSHHRIAWSPKARHCACWQTLVWRHSQMARQMVAQLWRHYKMTSKSHMKNHMSWSWRKVNCLFSLLRQEYPLILTSGEMLSHPGGWDKPIPEVNHLWRHRTSTLNNAEKSHLVCVLYLLYN